MTAEVPIEQGRISRYALEGGEPILVEDIQDSDRFRASEEAIRFRARSILSIPLFSQGDALGVLNFGGEEKGTSFTPQDRDLVVTLGRHVAVALEKARLVGGLRQTVAESIRALACAIEAKDPYTRGHSERVSRIGTLISEAMGLDEKTRVLLRRGGLVHDIGKLVVDLSFIHKPGKLDSDEWAIMKTPPEAGAKICAPLKSALPLIPLVRHHHERLDGTPLTHPDRGR